MFTFNELKEIALIRTTSPSVSLYLNLKEEGTHKQEFELRLKNLIKSYENMYASKAELKSLTKTFAQIAEFRANPEIKKGTEGLVIFANAEEKIWRVIEVETEVRTQLFVDQSFFVHPLMALIDNEELFVGAALDKKRVRLFAIHAGAVIAREHHEEEQEEPARHGDDHSKSDHDRQVIGRETNHERKLIALVDTFFKKSHAQRLIIGAPKSTLDSIRGLLPEHLTKYLIGTFHAELFQPDAALIDQFKREARAYEHAEEVKKITALTQSGMHGVRGIADVIAAANKGQIHELIVDFDTAFEGLHCESCSSLATKESTATMTCTHCGAQLHHVTDIIPFLVKRVMNDEGFIEFVHTQGEGAQEGLMQQISGIGASLKNN